MILENGKKYDFKNLNHALKVTYIDADKIK